jgi:hypothetical protein
MIQYTQSAIVLESLISQFLFNTAEKQGSKTTPPGASDKPQN